MRGFGTVAVTLFACLGLASAGLAQLSAEDIELKVSIYDRQEEMVGTLESWVNHNTGSWNREGLEAFAALLVPPLTELGFQVETLPGVELELPGVEDPRTGPIVLARRPAVTEKGTETDPEAAPPPRILLVGHFDTVFEPDSPFQEFERGTQRANGPGVADMKGGLVVLMYTLRTLQRRGALDAATWTLILNSDEELGSLGSRELIEREARDADYGFVFEASQRGGGMVRSRRGLGQFYLSVSGVAAHAGSSHDKGRSAVRALAEKIVLIEGLTDYDEGVTLNVGIVGGGDKRNIVPERAWAWIDLRYDAPEQGEFVQKELADIAAEEHVVGTEGEIWGRLHRPPKLISPGFDALLAAHAKVARDLGVELPEPVHAGGGTDGSLMGAAGLPTLDSMGVVGGRAHTSREFVDLESLPERTVIAVILLERLATGRALRSPQGAVD